METNAENQTPKLVVNIITHDPSILDTSFASFAKFADFVVVNYTGTDKTKLDVFVQKDWSVKGFGGLKIIECPWENDFAKARNQCLEATPDNSWVLWLDTDDVLSEDSIKHFKWLKKEVLDKGLTNTVYEMRLDNVDKDGQVIDTLYQRRIFPYVRATGKVNEFGEFEREYDLDNHPSILELKWVRKVHEKLTFDPVLFDSVRLDGPVITHTGYKDPEVLTAKNERNLKILLSIPYQEMDSLDKRYIGDAYASQKVYDRALFWYLEVTESTPELLFKIGICYETLGDFTKAKSYYAATGTKTGLGAAIIAEYKKHFNGLMKEIGNGILKYSASELPELEMYARVVQKGIEALKGDSK